MELTDYLIEKCQHDLSLLKSEISNIKHIKLINDAINTILEVKYDRRLTKP